MLASRLILRPAVVLIVALLLALAAFACKEEVEPALAPMAAEPGAGVSSESDEVARAVLAPAVAVPSRPLPVASATAPRLRDGARPPPELSARGAIVVDEASGAVLFEKNAHEPLPPASLVKVATAVVALQRGHLDTWVESDVNFLWDLDIGSSVMGLLPGDVFQLRDLIYGLMLPSGNDAALLIGRHIAGSDEAFVPLLNQLMARIGLRESYFVDAHGIDTEQNRASAYDLAMLARYAMSMQAFREIVATQSYTANGSRPLLFPNINGFIFGYEGGDGVKTGYVEEAGHTMIASATREGHRVYVVVLNAPLRDTDAYRLMNWAFESLTWG